MLIRCEIAKRERFEVESGIHRHNSLVIVLKGEFEYAAEGVVRRVLPFEPVFFKKGVSFNKKVVNSIEFIIVSSLQFSFECDGSFEYDEEDRVRLMNTTQYLIKAIKEDASDHVKEHFVNDIFLISKKNNVKMTQNTLLPAFEYISRNYSKKLSLNILAQINCCSVQTLISKFKVQTGKTPMEYITGLRIKKAKDFLLNTDLSIGQISEFCGYENVYYFSNVFKKEIGMSPLQFRKSSLL